MSETILQGVLLVDKKEISAISWLLIDWLQKLVDSLARAHIVQALSSSVV